MGDGMKNKGKMWLRAAKKDFGAFISIALLSDNNKYAGTNVEIKEIPVGQSIPILTELDMTQAQNLIDDLWDCGLRPSEGSGSAGAFKAVEYHLEDMRRIVFSPSFGFGPDDYSEPDTDKFLKENKDAGT